ncbi:LysR family transcriptional regulator [Bradyrhizobium elkanii]|nr:LysR family transcriptional regulator [Bradyrhizobium elkanii]
MPSTRTKIAAAISGRTPSAKAGKANPASTPTISSVGPLGTSLGKSRQIPGSRRHVRPTSIGRGKSLLKSIILICTIATMNLAAIDLNLLVAFEALMEERHVTRAAERIGLAQPSMSSALRRLRALFADELFLRAGAGMQPTEKALALAGPIGEALRQIRSALVPDQGFDPAIARRRITIAATDYGDLVVVPELTRLLAHRSARH